ncbi:MAG: ABC transporter permease subunit, partial [Aestuariivirgaceae bacterium]
MTSVDGRRLPSLKTIDLSRYIVYIGFAIIFLVLAIILHDDGFLSVTNLVNIVQQTTPVTIMAIGMVFVLTAGEIDLSVGSIVAISALIAAVVLREHSWLA